MKPAEKRLQGDEGRKDSRSRRKVEGDTESDYKSFATLDIEPK